MTQPCALLAWHGTWLPASSPELLPRLSFLLESGVWGLFLSQVQKSLGKNGLLYSGRAQDLPWDLSGFSWALSPKGLMNGAHLEQEVCPCPLHEAPLITLTPPLLWSPVTTPRSPLLPENHPQFQQLPLETGQVSPSCCTSF